MCEHNHNHTEEKEFSVIAIIIPVVIAIAAYFLKSDLLFIIAYITAGYDIILLSLKNISKGKIFDENFLMTIATIGALGLKEFPEAVSVMILYKIGETLQDRALDRSKESVRALINITPEYANIEKNGEILKVSPKDVNINDILVVKAGEKIPVDGTIIEGSSNIDTSSLTGESAAKSVKSGDSILSGCINLKGVLKIKAEKTYKDSTVSKIIDLIENARSKKSKTENFITKFAKYYTPCVVIIALLIAFIPFTINLPGSIWIERALTFLVISCPCALVISIPLTFFCAIGTASKYGILIKGSTYIEQLANAGIIAFDKTGTLTKGSFGVTDIKPYNGETKDKVLEYAAYAEFYSNHPIACAIKSKFAGNIDTSKISDIKEIAGKGIIAIIGGNEIIIGNKKLINEKNIELNEEKNAEVYILKNGILTGSITVSDKAKPEAKELVSKLENLKIKTVMLTGDNISNAQKTANELNIKEFYANLLPQDKVEKIEELMKRNTGKSTIFAGDGINDAPVLIRSDAGIAMGALGSDAAVESADIVIADDNIAKILTAVLISKNTIRIAKQNIILAIGIKVLFLFLSFIGFMTMWGAIFADVGVALIAILNAMRIRKY